MYLFQHCNGLLNEKGAVLARTVALSTSDNPYDPITQYDEWEQYDSSKRYFTNDFLDRICHTTHELGDMLYIQDIESAIDEAVKYNLISWQAEGVNYIKVVHED